MPSDGAAMVEAYRKVDAQCVAKGGGASPAPWVDALTATWLSGVFRMVVRKGRQTFASTCIAPRVAATTALFGRFDQARGTRGTIGFSSTRQKEADERLHNIERTFFDLGVRVKTRGDAIEVPNRPVIIQSFPATSEVARGVNAWMWWEDEMPAWRDGNGANPAHERDAAIVPACAMHPNARMYSVGTPLGLIDHHAKLVELGDTPSQRVFSGPSWHWNPTLTEARCRELQPNARLFDREFAAIPQGDVTSVFSLEDIDRAMRLREATLTNEHEWVLVIDASRGGDEWTFAVARWAYEEVAITAENIGLAPSGAPWQLAVAARERSIFDTWGRRVAVEVRRQDVRGEWHPFEVPAAAQPRPVLHVAELGAIPKAEMVDSDRAVWFLGRLCADRYPSLRRVFQDQYEAGALSVLLKRQGFRPAELTWTAPSKSRAVDRLERLLRDDQIRLPASETLRKQLLEYSEKITRTGVISYGGSGRHDDHAQVLITLAMASVSALLPGDPFGMDRRRHEIDPTQSPWSAEA